MDLPPHADKRRLRRRKLLLAAAAAGVIIMLPAALTTGSYPPGGFDTSSGPFAVREPARLLWDETGLNSDGQRVISQQIFDAMLQQVAAARHFILADFFLWNPWQGSIPEDHRELTRELTDALIAARHREPEMPIVVLSDPINRIYGRDQPEDYGRLKAAGIPVVFTDLQRLPDSNIIYSRLARGHGRWLRRIPGINTLLNLKAPNPFVKGGDSVKISQWLRLFHFKANHRKVLVSDVNGAGIRLLVTSLNPADGSAAHSNVGLQLGGGTAAAAARMEAAAVDWSITGNDSVLEKRPGDARRALTRLRERLPPEPSPEPDSNPRAWYLTEAAILRSLRNALANAQCGSEIRLGMFYLAERSLVKELLAAARRGSRVRIVLDPNRDAFGRRKPGIPNRCTAAELHRHARREGLDIEVRWAATSGEQYHTKALSVCTAEGYKALICGSANWTARNLLNRNLESAVKIEGHEAAIDRFNGLFDDAWENSGGLRRTEPYASRALSGWPLLWRTALYRIQERSGLGTF